MLFYMVNIFVNYVKVVVLVMILKLIEGGILFEWGGVIVDEWINILFICDMLVFIDEVRKIINVLDILVK